MSEFQTVRYDIDTTYDARVDGYILPKKDDGTLRPAMVICPGGGYYRVCIEREGYPIAAFYRDAGYQTFIVTYSTAESSEAELPAAFPRPLTQLMKAVKWVRDNAEAFGIDPNKIAVSGFSAGGHLAASLGVYWHTQAYLEQAGVTAQDCKPNAMVLVYPVLTTGWPEHYGGKLYDYLVGTMEYEDACRAFWLPDHVDEHTAPTFLCHTYMDDAVPVEDSLAFAKALSEHDQPFEMHIIPDGHHGLSTGTPDVNGGCDYPGFNEWPRLSLIWLSKIFGGAQPDPAQRSHGRFTLKKDS